MNSSKAQQSFSSYSQQENNEPHPSQDDTFSQYQENNQINEQNIKTVNEVKKKNVQKRRYSYGKLEQKATVYNYLNSINEIDNYQPAFYTSNIHNLKKCSYVKGLNSPCGVGAFQGSALEEYQKCYLSGLSKYYKSHNYNNKRQNRTFSVAQHSINKIKNLDRSQYWNGQKFQYLAEKQIEQKLKQQNNLKQRKQNQYKQPLQRNTASGLIVNKKCIKQNKFVELTKLKSKKDSNSYIKIEEDFSNSKNCLNNRNINLQNIVQIRQNVQQPLFQQPFKSNIEENQRNKQNDVKLELIQVKSKESILMQKQYTNLLQQKNELFKQNSLLRQALIQKNTQIERIASERVKDNQDYTQKISKLKYVFQTEKNSMIKDFEEQISIYKSVRKQAFKNQLAKQEQQRINLVIEKNKLQIQLKRVSLELIQVKQQLGDKNSKLNILNKELRVIEKHKNISDQKASDINKKQVKNKKVQQKNQQKMQGKILSKYKQIQKKQNLPQWVNNFLNVFRNMVVKLIQQVDQSWSDKKIIIVGWKVVKILIEKAVKIGIKMPQVINQNQIVSALDNLHNQKAEGYIKRYKLISLKNPSQH